MLSPHLKLPSARLLEMGEPAEISVAQKIFRGGNISCSDGSGGISINQDTLCSSVMSWKAVRGSTCEIQSFEVVGPGANVV